MSESHDQEHQPSCEDLLDSLLPQNCAHAEERKEETPPSQDSYTKARGAIKRGKTDELMECMCEPLNGWQTQTSYNTLIADAVAGGLETLAALCMLISGGGGEFYCYSPFGSAGVCRAVNAHSLISEDLFTQNHWRAECSHCSFDSLCSKEVVSKKARCSNPIQNTHVHRSCLYRHGFALLLRHAKKAWNGNPEIPFQLLEKHLLAYVRLLIQSGEDDPVYPEWNCFEILRETYGLGIVGVLPVKERMPYVTLLLKMWQAIRDCTGPHGLLILPEASFYEFLFGDPHGPFSPYDHQFIRSKYCVRAREGDDRSPYVLFLPACFTALAVWKSTQQQSFPDDCPDCIAGQDPFNPRANLNATVNTQLRK
jgi:hypothetical protein